MCVEVCWFCCHVFTHLSFYNNSLPVSAIDGNFYHYIISNSNFCDLPRLSNLFYYKCSLYTHMHSTLATFKISFTICSCDCAFRQHCHVYISGRHTQCTERRCRQVTTLLVMPIRNIYTTKIDGVVCPPNISETVATRIMKLTHRPRIASTMIKLISKPILLPILLILVKTIQRIVADPKRKLSPPFDLADSVPSLGHPGSGKMLSLFTVLCDYPVWVTETGALGLGKTIQPIRI